jgi:murein DD-endopeptidase MepM/ murein hydrolase activator NlpD
MKIFRAIQSNQINQRFGENANDFYRQLNLKGHNGVDFGTKQTEELRYDVDQDGTVVSLSLSPTAGFGITIDTEGYRHIYWHLKSMSVKVGDIIKLGNVLGATDNTGIYTTGPHLHRGLYQTTKDANGKASVINQDNGYGGAVDLMPFYTGIWCVDYIKQQMGIITKMVFILQQILNLMKK